MKSNGLPDELSDILVGMTNGRFWVGQHGQS